MTDRPERLVGWLDARLGHAGRPGAREVDLATSP